jgi:hypothetical protein
VKCIIHIGTAKAGSTSIQLYLQKYRTQLRDQCILIPKFDSLYSNGANHKALAYYAAGNDWIDTDKYHDQEETKKQWMSNFEHHIKCIFSEINPKEIHTVALSSEQLHLNVNHNLQVNRIKVLLDNFFDEFVIVIYLKPQSTVAISRFSQQMKGRGGSTSMLPENPDISFYDYLNLIDIWSNTFGIESLRLGILDDGGEAVKDVISDFTSHLSVDTSLTPPLGRNSNLSLDGISIDLLMHINPFFRSDRNFLNQKLKRLIDKYLVNIQSTGKKMPSKQQAIDFDALFIQMNHTIEKKYLNGNNLFTVNYDKYPEFETPLSSRRKIKRRFTELKKHVDKVLTNEISDKKEWALLANKIMLSIDGAN